MSCECPKGWRLEALDLATGAKRGRLHFTDFSFDEQLNVPGPGTITIPLGKVRPRDIWPHLVAVAFLRTAGPDASEGAPVCEYIGMIQTIKGDTDSGTVQVGMDSIENYLNFRMIVTGATWTSLQQTVLAALWVNLATSGGIPLTGTSETSAVTVTQTVATTDDKMILPLVADLCGMDNGPDYIRDYTYTASTRRWSTALRFVDVAGGKFGILDGRRGLVAYGMEVDGTDQANWIRGRSQDNSSTQDTLSTSPYPRFDAGVQWSDLTNQPLLVKRVGGALKSRFDPNALPDLTIADLTIASKISIGDTGTVRLDDGFVQYDGPARVVIKSWAVTQETPTTCTLTFVPYGDNVAVPAILNSSPRSPLEVCC